MEFVVAAYTDIGNQKPSNQDSFCLRRAVLPEGGEMLLVVVCDGMGGLQKGELASAEAVHTFADWFDSNLNMLSKMCASGFQQVRCQWETMILALHQRLLGYAQTHQIQLGTTLTAIFIFGDRYLTVNVGDSRIYENKYVLQQLTQDQSLVAQEVACGRITPEQASHHPQRNILLQCLGTGSTVIPVLTEGPLLSNAIYLLCTDGFSHELTHEELSERLSPVCLRDKDALTQTLISLTETCKQRGETDNITAVLIKTAETHRVPQKRFDLRNLLKKQKSNSNAAHYSGTTLVETAQIIYTDERI